MGSETGAKGYFRTVAQKHKEQLKKLMETLHKTYPHFVRCIIPNYDKKNNIFVNRLVLNQLKCNGVMEGIRISRIGFPSRISFSDFIKRYQFLKFESQNTNNEFMCEKGECQFLLKVIPDNTYRIGKSLIFLKQGVLADLESMRECFIEKLLNKIKALSHVKINNWRLKEQEIKGEAGLALRKNVLRTIALKNWFWWKLYFKVKPLLDVTRKETEKKVKDDEIAKLRETTREINEKLCELQKKYKKSKNNNKSMEESLNNEVEKNSELFNQKDKLIYEFNKLKQETSSKILQIGNELVEIKKQNELKKSKIENLTKELDLKKELTDLKSKEENKLSTKITELVKRIDILEKENSCLRKENNEKLQKISKQEADLTEQETQSKNVSQQNTKLYNTIDRIKKENEDLIIEKQKLENTIHKTEQEQKNLQAYNFKISDQLNKEKIITTQSKTEVNDLKKEISKITEELEKMNSLKNDEYQSLKSYEVKCALLEKKLAKEKKYTKEIMQERDKALKDNLEAVKYQLETVYEKERNFITEKKKLGFQIRKLEQENIKLKALLETNEESSENLIEEERKTRIKLQEEMLIVKAENLSLANEIELKEKNRVLEIEELLEKNRNLEQKIEKSKENLEKVENNIKNELLKHINDYRNDNIKLKNEISILKTKINKEKLNFENQKLKHENTYKKMNDQINSYYNLINNLNSNVLEELENLKNTNILKYEIQSLKTENINLKKQVQEKVEELIKKDDTIKQVERKSKSLSLFDTETISKVFNDMIFNLKKENDDKSLLNEIYKKDLQIEQLRSELKEEKKINNTLKSWHVCFNEKKNLKEKNVIKKNSI